MFKSIITVSTLILVSSCSSNLKVFDENNKEAKGIPINAPQLVEITTTTSYKVAEGSERFAALCTSEVSSKIEVLPLGQRYYVNFEAAALGDSEFSIEYNDKGLVKTISLNSKASSGLEQTSSLLSTVLPYIKAEKSTPVASTDKSTPPLGDISAQKLKDLHCLKNGSVVSSIKKASIQ